MALLLKRHTHIREFGVQRLCTFLRSHRAAMMSTNEQKTCDTVYHEKGDHEAKKVWPDSANISFDPYDQMKFPLPGNSGVVFSTHKNPPLPLPLPTAPIKQENFVLESRTAHETQCDIMTQHVSQAAQTSGTTVQDKATLDVELRVQDCPMLVRKDFQDLFPQYNVMRGDFTVVTICQKTDSDMSTWSEKVDEERDDLYKLYSDTARELCQTLQNAGFWADFIDPCSGKPHLGPHTTDSLFETDERYRHFGFEIEDLGCCKIIKHHRWGAKSYVGSIFTNAPVDAPILMDLVHFSIQH